MNDESGPVSGWVGYSISRGALMSRWGESKMCSVVRLLLLSLLLAAARPAQTQSLLELEHLYNIPSTCFANTMTMKQDATGLPFLYVAAKEGGLRIFNISAAPKLVKTIPASAFRSLHVTNLSQSGTRLFLALGNHFSASQSPGLAVIDVSKPAAAAIVDLWYDPNAKGGAGIVEIEDGRAYLGAMGNGLVVFEISDAGKLHLLSRFVPSITFPDSKPNPKSRYNVRGLAVRDGLVYLTYDAGGLRIIDVRDEANPVEIGRYSNPVMNGKQRAYNNVVLDGALAYVAVDYCGLEVLNVAKPAAIKLVSWWNPWKCQASPWNWFKSPGHTNEIVYDSQCKLLFLSSGKSDLQVVSVADPARPAFRGGYGGTANKIGTWGVSRHGDRIYLSYICTLGIPFQSNWSGVKILGYDRDACE